MSTGRGQKSALSVFPGTSRLLFKGGREEPGGGRFERGCWLRAGRRISLVKSRNRVPCTFASKLIPVTSITLPGDCSPPGHGDNAHCPEHDDRGYSSHTLGESRGRAGFSKQHDRRCRMQGLGLRRRAPPPHTHRARNSGQRQLWFKKEMLGMLSYGIREDALVLLTEHMRALWDVNLGGA